jgi:hypothetical protein
MREKKLLPSEKQLLGMKSGHEWRVRQRSELTAAVRHAAEVYLSGSAYTPPTAMSLSELLRHMRAKLTVKEWRR